VLTLNSTTTLEVSVVSSEVGSRVLGRIEPSERIVQTKRLGYSNGRVKGRKSLAKSGGGGRLSLGSESSSRAGTLFEIPDPKKT